MEHKIKSEITQFESSGERDVTFSQMYLDIDRKELRQFIECLELLEKQLK